MINKKIIIFLIVMGLLSAPFVSAEQITVTEKHIIGNDGVTYGGPLFILTNEHQEDYLVTIDTYYKVHTQDVIELTAPDKYGYCELASTNNYTWW